jgi:hypothetical protein
MRETAKRLWRFLLASLLTVIYFCQKYGISLFVFPFVCQNWGIVYGTLMLMVIIAFTSYGQLKTYDKTEKVFHTIDWIHRVKNGEGGLFYHRILRFIFRRNRWFVFIFLSTQFDPFVTIVWSETTNSFRARRIVQFLWSYAIGIAYSVKLFSTFKMIFIKVMSFF